MPDSHLDANGFVVLDPAVPTHLSPEAIAACTTCDSDGYTPALVVCDHQLHATAETRAAAMAEIRAALAKETR